MIMKERMAVLLLAVCLVLSGCVGGNSVTEGAFPSDKSPQNGYNLSSNKYISSRSLLYPFVETENVFYGLNAGRLCYYDRQSGISGILCPDPSCTHADDSCGAYIIKALPFAMLTMYDGKLYWMGRESWTNYNSLCLWRCDPDGTNHERCRVLDFEKYGNYNVRHWMIYGDKLFFEACSETAEGEQAGYRVRFGYLPPDSDEETILLDEFKTKAVSTDPHMYYLNGKIFYSLAAGSSELKILCYDSKKDTTELLLDTDDFAEINRNWYGMCVTEDETVHIATGRAVYVVTDGALVEKYALSDGERSFACMGDGIVAWGSIADGYRMIEIRDFEGTLLYSGKLFPEPVEGFDETLGMWGGGADKPGFGLAVLGGDSEKIVVNMISMGTVDGSLSVDQNHVFLLDIRDNMKATHLWTIGTATMYEPD